MFAALLVAAVLQQAPTLEEPRERRARLVQIEKEIAASPVGWPGLSIGMTLGGFAGLVVVPGPLVLLMSVFTGAHLGATATLLAVGGVVALVAMAVVGVIVGTIGVFSGLITAERRQARIKELQQERIGLSFSLG